MELCNELSNALAYYSHCDFKKFYGCQQVEERRRAIEAAERERREALLKKNMEREERIEQKRRHQARKNREKFWKKIDLNIWKIHNHFET